jgi:hypothetical protein
VTDARWVAAFADRYLDFEKLRILGVSPPTSADAVLSGTGGWR